MTIVYDLGEYRLKLLKFIILYNIVLYTITLGFLERQVWENKKVSNVYQ